jgi:HlyD family secretion protein
MDKTIEKQGAPVRTWVIAGIVGVAAVGLVWELMARASSSRFTVDPNRLTTAVAHKGDFLEYYPFDGTVQPATSVYLDVEEGGRVEAVYAEGGQHVEKGDLILKFSNISLQQTSISTETSLLYNLDVQRDSQFNREQNGLLLRDALLDLEHQIVDAQNKYHRYEQLEKDGNTAISFETFETQRNQLQYLQDKRDLLKERIKKEDELSREQLAAVQNSISKLNTSLALLGQIVKSLEIRAPISGFLSTIDAKVGQNVNAGQRIGQIDLLDKLKVRVRTDQFYISRVEPGTPGHVNLDGKTWDVKVTKVYPEVKDSTFEADAIFTDAVPETLKRGQTLTVELSFGSPTQALMVSKGGYFQSTSGRWVYLVSKDGRSARRTDVRLGKQNPRDVEVLEGLSDGDRIITSAYDTFNAVDELKFTTPLKADGNRT